MRAVRNEKATPTKNEVALMEKIIGILIESNITYEQAIKVLPFLENRLKNKALRSVIYKD